MAAAEQDLSNGRFTELIEPSDLIPLRQASEKFNIRADTLLYRIKHNKLPSYWKELDGKQVHCVSIADMEKQPPVDPKYQAKNQKRPDVAERNKLKRKYNKKGTSDVSQPQKESRSNDQEEDRNFERHVCYAFGRVQAWLDIYAGSIGLTPSILTDRVGQLLQAGESRSSLGLIPKLPRM